MLFKVTHIDRNGARRRARVTAANPGDALEQMEQEFGESRAGGVVRLAVRPALRLVDGLVDELGPVRKVERHGRAVR